MCYLMKVMSYKTFHKGVKMGQQLNKIQKRRRRKAYLERCKERVRAAIGAATRKK